MRNRKGFTLIELLICIMILGILASVAYTSGMAILTAEKTDKSNTVIRQKVEPAKEIKLEGWTIKPDESEPKQDGPQRVIP